MAQSFFVLNRTLNFYMATVFIALERTITDLGSFVLIEATSNLVAFFLLYHILYSIWNEIRSVCVQIEIFIFLFP